MRGLGGEDGGGVFSLGNAEFHFTGGARNGNIGVYTCFVTGGPINLFQLEFRIIFSYDFNIHRHF